MTSEVYAGLVMIGFFILMGGVLYALDAVLDRKEEMGQKEDPSDVNAVHAEKPKQKRRKGVSKTKPSRTKKSQK